MMIPKLPASTMMSMRCRAGQKFWPHVIKHSKTVEYLKHNKIHDDKKYVQVIDNFLSILEKFKQMFHQQYCSH